MKRTIISILIIAALLMALTGCGRTENNEVVNPTPPADNGTVRPEDDNGMVEDNNGIIGDAGQNGDRPNEGILPEIGNDIEQGANDVIDSVGDAVTGNDNNAGSNNGSDNNETDTNGTGETRGRIRMR